MDNENQQLIDSAKVYELAGGDVGFVREYLSRMLTDNDYDLECIDRAITTRHWEDVAHHLHRLSGSVKLAGSDTLAEQCQEMESMARFAPDTDALREEFSFLLVQFTLLSEEACVLIESCTD